MELPCRYPYNPRWQMILFGAAFFGAGGVFMAHKAMHNSAGLIINGIITLGPTGAIVFYWVIAAACGVFVLGSLIFTIRRVVSPGSRVRNRRSDPATWLFADKGCSRTLLRDPEPVGGQSIGADVSVYHCRCPPIHNYCFAPG